MKIEHVIISVLILAVVVLGYIHFIGSASGILSADEAAQGALAFINSYMLQPGNEAELVGEVIQENGLYKFTINIGGQEVSSYVTKDGAILFPQGGVNLEEVKAEMAGAAEEDNTPKTCGDINVEKQAEPLLEAFVVSYCPYGLQMQRVITGIVNEAPEMQKNIKIRYIGDVENGEVLAMHGVEEAQENLRQICIREEQADKFYSYLECFMKQGKTEACLIESKIDESALESCITTPSKGIKYAEEDFALQNEYKVTGSPTLLLNGVRVSEFDFGGRTPEAVKTLFCCGYEAESPVCSEELSTEQAAVGFSESTTGSGSTGSCD